MPKRPSSATLYENLRSVSKRTTILSSIAHLLEWDQETYMPSDGIQLRLEQMKMISHLIHSSATGKTFSNALTKLIDLRTAKVKRKGLTPSQCAALREWLKEWRRGSKLPTAFVTRLSETTTHASYVWKDAKEHNDFKTFAPHLETIVSLLRKKADLLGYGDHPYDALLSHYEADLTISFLSPIFVRLKSALKQLLQRILNKPKPAHRFLHAHCPKKKQLELSQFLLDHMGLRPEASRLDLSAHPFCSSLYPLDTRLTTLVYEENVLQTLFAVLHEGGHALYSMGLPLEHFGSPLCETISLGIDESQSRFWETCIGQSRPFWTWFFPHLQKIFPSAFDSIHFEDFMRALHHVEPHPIRIEADEVTYNLHILLRFELEQGLIDGSIAVQDIPYLWDKKMGEFLGITPQWDSEGCLQDIHWAIGAIGYFPTYTLGNLYAAQFMEAFVRAHPNWEARVSTGDLSFIRAWLLENIHRHGKRYSASELCKRITGKPLSERPFIQYLEKKYA